MSPNSGSAGIGESGYMFTPLEMRRDCNYLLYGPYTITNTSSWYSNNSGIVSVTNSGIESCLSAGQAQIQGIWPTVVGWNTYSCGCCPINGYGSATAMCNVLPTISIGDVSFTGPNPLVSGNEPVTGSTPGVLSATVGVSTGAPPNATFTIEVDPIAGSGNVTITSISPARTKTFVVGAGGETGISPGELKTVTFGFNHDAVQANATVKARVQFSGTTAPAGTIFHGSPTTSSNSLVVSP